MNTSTISTTTTIDQQIFDEMMRKHISDKRNQKINTILYGSEYKEKSPEDYDEYKYINKEFLAKKIGISNVYKLI